MAGTLNFGPIEKIKKNVSYNIKRSLHAKFGWNPLNATDRPTDRPKPKTLESCSGAHKTWSFVEISKKKIFTNTIDFL